MDVRTRDAVRRMDQKMITLMDEVESIRSDLEILKKLTRAIKDSVTRKYEKSKG